MEDIKRRDTQVFVRRLFSARLVVGAIVFGIFALATVQDHAWGRFLVVALSATLAMVWHAWSSYRNSHEDRFHDHRLRDQWKHCEDRVRRLSASLKELRKANVADLEELPKNVDRLAADIYIALRRADLVMYEAEKSEGRLTQPKTVSLPNLPDKQAQDLLRQADRNIAEYNAHMQKLMATVQRTEAQVMVFITTLDSLRARMLHYKASPRPAEVDNQEFMAAIREAKMQFDAIDMALEEIDAPLTSMPLPENTTEEAPIRQNLGSLGPPPVPGHLTGRPNLGSLGPPPTPTEDKEEEKA